jgi:short-subunit dehydrogenase
MTVSQKYALVTGGTSGIGLELAKLLAADKYNIVLVARSQEELNKTSADLGSQFGIKTISIAKDLFNVKAAFEVHDIIRAKGLQIDILVNDAGQGLYGEFVDTDIKRELDIIQLNISSLVVLTKLFLQEMIKSGSGKILNVSSVASKVPGPFQSVYHGTKAFVQSFSQAIRDEVKDTGITITTLLPGVTDTDFFNKADMLESKALADEEEMADPAKVAKDGYEALKNGDTMVVSGTKNKMQVAMAAVTPDSILAKKVHEQQEPVNEKK